MTMTIGEALAPNDATARLKSPLWLLRAVDVLDRNRGASPQIEARRKLVVDELVLRELRAAPYR